MVSLPRGRTSSDPLMLERQGDYLRPSYWQGLGAFADDPGYGYRLFDFGTGQDVYADGESVPKRGLAQGSGAAALDRQSRLDSLLRERGDTGLDAFSPDRIRDAQRQARGETPPISYDTELPDPTIAGDTRPGSSRENLAVEDVKRRGGASAFMSPEEFDERNLDLGLTADRPMTYDEERILREDKIREQVNLAMMEGAPLSLQSLPLHLAAGMLRIAQDPAEAATMFIPFVREERMAAMTARLGVRGANIQRGAIEAGLGSLAAEVPYYALSQVQQRDWTMANSLVNVGAGTLFGTGIGAVRGHFAERSQRRADERLKAIDFAARRARGEKVDMTEFDPRWLSEDERKQLAFRTAIAQAMDGQEIDVKPLADIDDFQIREIQQTADRIGEQLREAGLRDEEIGPNTWLLAGFYYSLLQRHGYSIDQVAEAVAIPIIRQYDEASFVERAVRRGAEINVGGVDLRRLAEVSGPEEVARVLREASPEALRAGLKQAMETGGGVAPLPYLQQLRDHVRIAADSVEADELAARLKRLEEAVIDGERWRVERESEGAARTKFVATKWSDTAQAWQRQNIVGTRKQVIAELVRREVETPAPTAPERAASERSRAGLGADLSASATVAERLAVIERLRVLKAGEVVEIAKRWLKSNPHPDKARAANVPKSKSHALEMLQERVRAIGDVSTPVERAVAERELLDQMAADRPVRTASPAEIRATVADALRARNLTPEQVAEIQGLMRKMPAADVKRAVAELAANLGVEVKTKADAIALVERKASGEGPSQRVEDNWPRVKVGEGDVVYAREEARRKAVQGKGSVEYGEDVPGFLGDALRRWHSTAQSDSKISVRSATTAAETPGVREVDAGYEIVLPEGFGRAAATAEDAATRTISEQVEWLGREYGKILEAELYRTADPTTQKAIRAAYERAVVEGKAEAERAAALAPERDLTGARIVTAPNGMKVRVQDRLVDMDSLEHASGDLQPRDRAGRKASDEQIATMASDLDPDRLMPSGEADRGAPIVIRRGDKFVILSGNGRVAAIRRAYDLGGASAERYRDAVQGSGRAVMVSEIVDDLSPAQLREFVVAANQSATARMSATETANIDARVVGDALALYDGEAGLTSGANRAFVTKALSGIPVEERAALVDASGALNAEGVRRLEAGLFARAYSDPSLTALMAESVNNPAKGILRAMLRVAGDWSIMRRDAADGVLKAEADVTPHLLAAVRMIINARDVAAREGRPVATVLRERVAQTDIFEGDVAPEVKGLIHAFFKDDNLSRQVSEDDIADFLRSLARELRAVQSADGNLFGDALSASNRDVIDAARKAAGAEVGRTFGDPEGFGEGAGGLGREAREFTPEEHSAAIESVAQDIGPEVTAAIRETTDAIDAMPDGVRSIVEDLDSGRLTEDDILDQIAKGERTQEDLDAAMKLLYEESGEAGRVLMQTAPRIGSPEFFDRLSGTVVKDADGKIAPVYHASPEKFTDFSDAMAGTRTDTGWLGKGHYFYTQPTRSYGRNLYESYVDIRKPVRIPFVDDPTAQSLAIVEQVPELRSTFDKLKTERGKKYVSPMILIGEFGADRFTEAAKRAGFDGVVEDQAINVINALRGRKPEGRFQGLDGEIVAFDESQIYIARGPDETADAFPRELFQTGQPAPFTLTTTRRGNAGGMSIQVRDGDKAVLNIEIKPVEGSGNAYRMDSLGVAEGYRGKRGAPGLTDRVAGLVADALEARGLRLVPSNYDSLSTKGFMFWFRRSPKALAFDPRAKALSEFGMAAEPGNSVSIREIGPDGKLATGLVKSKVKAWALIERDASGRIVRTEPVDPKAYEGQTARYEDAVGGDGRTPDDTPFSVVVAQISRDMKDVIRVGREVGEVFDLSKLDINTDALPFGADSPTFTVFSNLARRIAESGLDDAATKAQRIVAELQGDATVGTIRRELRAAFGRDGEDLLDVILGDSGFSSVRGDGGSRAIDLPEGSVAPSRETLFQTGGDAQSSPLASRIAPDAEAGAFSSWFRSEIGKALSTSDSAIKALEKDEGAVARFFRGIADIWHKLASRLRGEGYANARVANWLRSVGVDPTLTPRGADGGPVTRLEPISETAAPDVVLDAVIREKARRAGLDKEFRDNRRATTPPDHGNVEITIDGEIRPMKGPVAEGSYVLDGNGKLHAARRAGEDLADVSPEDARRMLMQTATASESVRQPLEGFESTATRALRDIDRGSKDLTKPSGTPEEWKKELIAKGAKPKELAAMGWDARFEGANQKLSRQDVLDFIESAQPELEVKVLGGSSSYSKESDVRLPGGSRELTFNDRGNRKTFRIKQAADGSYDIFTVVSGSEGRLHTGVSSEAQAEHIIGGTIGSADGAKTRFGPGSSTPAAIPGGEPGTYREVLIRDRALGQDGRLSPADIAERQGLIEEYDRLASKPAFETDAERARFKEVSSRLDAFTEKAKPYTSKHFHDQEVVHLRVDDREVEGVGRTLFVQEIQSDIHQDGRTGGYRSTDPEIIARAEGEVASAKSAVDRATQRQDEAERQLFYAVDKYVRDTSIPNDQSRLITDKLLSEDPMARTALARNSFTKEHVEGLMSLDARRTYVDAVDQARSTTKALNDAQLSLTGVREGPPRAALESNWHEVAVKQALRMAAREGYDAVAFSRSDQIGPVVGNTETLGKFYDEIIPRFLRKYVKGLGGEVESRGIGNPVTRYNRLTDDQRAAVRKAAFGDANAQQKLTDLPEAEFTAALDRANLDANPLIRLTPEMREALTSRPQALYQTGRDFGPQGVFQKDTGEIALFKTRDESTFMHESAHYFLEVYGQLSVRPDAPESLKTEMRTILDWLGVESWRDVGTLKQPKKLIKGNDITIFADNRASKINLRTSRFGGEWRVLDVDTGAYVSRAVDKERAIASAIDYATNKLRVEPHEKWARGFEQYLREGNAPSNALAAAFEAFKNWLTKIYRSARDLKSDISPEVREVMSRMIAPDEMLDVRKLIGKPGPEARARAAVDGAYRDMERILTRQGATGDADVTKTHAAMDTLEAKLGEKAAMRPLSRVEQDFLDESRGWTDWKDNFSRGVDMAEASAEAGKGAREIQDELLAAGLNETDARMIAQEMTGEMYFQLADAALALKDKASSMAAERRRAAALNKDRRAALLDAAREAYQKYGRVHLGVLKALGGVNRALDAIGQSADAIGNSMARAMQGALGEDLLAKRLIEPFRSGDYDAKIVAELDNMQSAKPRAGSVSGDKTAYEIAKAVHKAQETARRMQNESGAWIRDTEVYIAGTSHDARTMTRRGYVQWRNEIAPLLNWSKIELDGKTQEEFLRSVFDAVTSGYRLGKPTDDVAQAFRGPRNIARSVSQHRLLHFVSGDAWLKYNQEFGSRSLFDSVMSELDGAGRTIGLLDVFGTNPEAMLKLHVEDVAREIGRDMPDFQKLAGRDGVNKQLSAIMAELTGEAAAAESANMAAWGSSLRAVQSMAKLGMATFSALGDTVMGSAKLMQIGHDPITSFAGGFRMAIEGIAKTRGMGDGDLRRWADVMGVGMDGTLGMMTSRIEHADDFNRRTQRAMNRFFKLTLMTQWTDAMKRGAAMMFGAELGMKAGKSFSELRSWWGGDRFTRYLMDSGITEADWRELGTIAVRDIEGRKMMDPGLIFQAAERATTDAERSRLLRLGKTVQSMIVEFAESASPTPGARDRAVMHQGHARGTYSGEAYRFIFQFKAFPITVLRKVMGPMLMRQGGFYDGSNVGNVAAFIAMSWMMGGAVMMLKDIAKGRTPRDATSDDSPLPFGLREDFAAAALMQSGGLGIYGDFLLGRTNRFGGGVLGTVAGPTIGAAAEGVELWQKFRHQAFDGEIEPGLGGDLARFVQSNTPYANAPIVKQTLDYLIIWNLQEMLNPGYQKRAEKRLKKNTGSEYYIPPSSVIERGGGFK